MSDNTVTAIVTGVVGLLLVLLARWLLHHATARWLQAVENRRGAAEAASLRTRVMVMERVVVVFLVAIVVWQVLSIYPATDKLANAILASGAALALIIGLAFSTPLSNIGGGVLLAFSQPVRIGDRIAVVDISGTVEEITLIHTVLVTDEDRRVFVPNVTMISSAVVNRSIVDPRRTVTVELPLALASPLERAKTVVLDAAREALPGESEVAARITSLSESTAWLTVTALAPSTADVAALAGDVRERALTALGREQLI